MAVLTPPAKVQAAMPGTLKDISDRTGYPAGEVLKQIGNLRREGVRVNAAAEPGALGVRWPIEAGVASTWYSIDATSGEE